MGDRRMQSLRRRNGHQTIPATAGPLLVVALILAAAGNLPGQQLPSPGQSPAPQSGLSNLSVFDLFILDIDPTTPVHELVPALPKLQPGLEPGTGQEPGEVPELSLQEPFAPKLSFGIGLRNTAHLVFKIKFLNQKKPDGFIQGLVDHRPDLQGLPFAMGKDCQMSAERGPVFKAELDMLRSASSKTGLAGQSFWNSYEYLEAERDKKLPKIVVPGKKWSNPVIPTRLDVLTHIAPLFMAPHRTGFVKYLTGTAHPEATRTLAKLALFAPEPEMRQLAGEALAIRREKDYTDVLLAGMRYPWPEVAKRAAAALVLAERPDLAGQLVDLLDQPDPRLPKLEKVNGKEMYRAKQLVRLNHHQNCFLCHEPVVPGAKFPNYVVTAPVPMPDRPLPVFSQAYYNPSKAQVLVRVDVTYLRPDFSVMLKVSDANPWPELQRYDFLVRSVEITKAQAETLKTKVQNLNGTESPYQKAVLTTLRELTGLDAGTTAPEWRKALKLPG